LGKSPTSTSGGKRTRITIELEGKMAQLYKGEITVQDMDNEELARMQFKAADGTFRGRRPNNLPQALVNMMRKELIDRVSEVRRAALAEANETLIKVIRNDSAKDADRIKAALALIEREEGKVPEKVELSTGDKGFEVTMARAVRMRRPGSTPAEED
jgi:hypothetical protein